MSEQLNASKNNNQVINMKSSLFFKILIIAVVFAVVGYFTAGIFDIDATTVAISLFIGAFIAPFISKADDAVSDNDQQEIKTLYVGNLPYRANEAAVRRLFSEHGFVHSVRLMKDKHTGKRRGFGFVEMAASDAENAIAALNDTEFQQRTLKIREAKDRPDNAEDDDE